VAAPLAAWASGDSPAGLHWSSFGASAEFPALPLAL